MPKRTQKEILRVTAGVILRNGRILIARRRDPDTLAGLWEFPGGKIEPGEQPEECLARELREELSLTGVIGPLLQCSLHRSGLRTLELCFYRVTRPRGRVTLRDHTAFAWVRPAELSAYLWVPADAAFAAQLADGTFAALLRTAAPMRGAAQRNLANKAPS